MNLDQGILRPNCLPWGRGLVVLLVACGGRVDDDATEPPAPSLFIDTPPALRPRTRLGEAPLVPNLSAYLGEFERSPLGPFTFAPPCKVQRFALRSFRAQEYPWTYADYRTCVREGACPSFEPAVRERSSQERESYSDNDYARVPFAVAEASCRAHGGELPSNAQRAALAQGGEARAAWAAFEADVYTRCRFSPPCSPYLAHDLPAVRGKLDELPETRGPFGHRGLLFVTEWVRYFESSYRWTDCRAGTWEIGDYEPGAAGEALSYVLQQSSTVPVVGSPVDTSVEPGPALAFRCMFPGDP